MCSGRFEAFLTIQVIDERSLKAAISQNRKGTLGDPTGMGYREE